MDKLIKIPYGDGEKSFKIDEKKLLYNIMPSLPPRPTAEEEEAKVRGALDNPIGTERIEDFVKSGDRVALLVDDWTRPTPAFKVAPLVLEELSGAGIKDEDVKVIIARGTHAPLNRGQLEAKLGRRIIERFRVQNHEPGENLMHLGASRKGTPVWINRAVMEADIKIAIGGICTHPIAGYGGGAKIIVPGVAGIETINRNHSLADDPKAAIGVADGNPIREDMEDIARMAGLDFVVNVILNPQKEVIEVVAGDVIKAHRTGVEIYNQIYGVRVGKEADIVVLGASPRDATLYHGTFALPCAVSMVKEKGTIIWVAPCLTGPGSKEERQRFRRTLSIPPDELMRSIKESALKGRTPPSGGVFDWCTSRVVHRNKVVLISDLISGQEAREWGFDHGDSIQRALDEAIKVAGGDAKVTVIPVGGLTVPIIA